VIGSILAGTLLFVLYSFIGTFIFGVFVYYATRPFYRRLRTRISPPSLAAAVSILMLALPAVLLGAYTLAVGLNQLQGFLENRGGQFEALQGLLDPYFDISAAVQDPGMLLENPDVVSFLRGGLDAALSYAGLVGNGLLHLFVMLALAFYLLRDGPRLSRWAIGRFGDNRGVLDRYLAAVDRDFSSIFFGNILNALLTSIIGAVCYNVLNFALAGPGVPYPYLVGLLTGVASLVPVVGMKLVYVPVGAYLGVAGAGSPDGIAFLAAFLLVSFFIVDVLPDFVLRPYVSGRNLHVGSVMFAYIFGPLLFGWYGIFLGPVILVLTVQFGRLVLPELVSREPIRPYAVDPGTTLAPPPIPDDAPAGDADSGTGTTSADGGTAGSSRSRVVDSSSGDGLGDADAPGGEPDGSPADAPGNDRPPDSTGESDG